MINPKRTVQAVDDGIDIGVYMWKFADGSYLSDGDGNYLNIAGRRHDIEKMAKLQEVVKHYGIEDGTVIFMPGMTRVTDEEYADDKERFMEGKTTYGDFGAFKDGNKNRRR